jgi:type I restriction enzyme S subunit
MELKDIATYVKDRIEVEKLSLHNYISTENMLPEKGGVQPASSLPSISMTSSFRKDDVLTSNIRPYFKKIWIANKEGGCSNDVLVLRAKNSCYPKFLYYVLSENRFFDYSTASAKGTKMPRGDKSAIMGYKVPCFCFSEQMAIADILSSLDDKIALNKRINDNLEQQAQALYKSWFVDFEPFIDGKFVDSELGEIPEGWRVGKLSEVGKIVGGSTPSKKHPEYYTDNGISWLTPKDLSINRRKFTSRGEIDITDIGYKSCSTQMLPKGTILFSSRAPIGYISIAQNEICTNQGFKSVVPNKEIGSAFIFYYLKTNTFEIESKASGSTFKEASGSLMNSLSVIIPTLETMQKFNEIVNPIFSQQAKNEDENEKLSTVRDSLLPKLMSGELKTGDLRR